MNLQAHLQACFEKAENEESKLCQEILDMDGMTGQMTRHFYNNLLSIDNIRYLEIGTWMGSSTCAAMYGNKSQVVCIDNWSEFGGETAKEAFLMNIDTFKGENQIIFLEQDCFKVDVTTLPKFNIYLYDGGHNVEDHYKALTHYIDCMEDEFIYVCDDWDWAAVREGTLRALKDLGLEVVSYIERSLMEGDTWKPTGYARATWWNGIWAAVLRKSKNLK